MADVVIIAPLVTFEGEDWNECRELLTPQNLTITAPAEETDLECRCRRFLDNLNGSQSTREQLLIDWTATNTTTTTATGTTTSSGKRGSCLCFGGIMAPRNNRTASLHETSTDNPFSDNLIWNQIPEKYDNSESQKQRQQSESISYEDSENSFGKNRRLSEEDDDNVEAMEMSVLSVAGSTGEEPIKSADEVISEIVEMMEDDLESDFELCSASPSKTTEILKTKLQHMKQTGNGLSVCLQEMPLEKIHSLHEELDQAIRDYSEVLLCQLVLREELVFQRELFNQFISLLLSIQKKRRMLDVDRRKGKPVAEQPTYRYLTTVIPYDDHQKIPDADLLQIYIKILSAIDEDNFKVPALLTDYILNVLCPKS